MRAAAESATRGGFAPWSLDQFADEDLRATGPATVVSGDPQSWIAALTAAPAAPWLYTGGPENQPNAIGKLAALRPLWGVSGRALRHVRDPFRLANVLRQEGWAALPVAPGQRPPADGDWVRKPWRSGGGFGITLFRPKGPVASPPPPLSRRHYFQRRLPACTPILGATYLMADRQARLLGVAEQFHGLNASNALHGGDSYPDPTVSGDQGRHRDGGVPWEGQFRSELAFVYRGSIAFRPAPAAFASLEQLGDLLARRFALRGIIGVDVGFHDGHCWVLEVNPRYPASAELFEHDDALGIGDTGLSAYASALAEKSSTVTTAAKENGLGAADRVATVASRTVEDRPRLARSLVALHAEVWQGSSVDGALHACQLAPAHLPLGVPGLSRGKWIVYAKLPTRWPPAPIEPSIEQSTGTSTEPPSGLTTGPPTSQILEAQSPGRLWRLDEWVGQPRTSFAARSQRLPSNAVQARLADIPAAATEIPAARPICTLLACSADRENDEALRRALHDLEAKVLRWLADGTG